MTGVSVRADHAGFAAAARDVFAFEAVIDEISELRWQVLTVDELMQVAKAYYFFSIQFRENLEIACRLYPADSQLQKLREGECDTDNLSPWPGIAEIGERLDHDEFMRRLLDLQPIADDDRLTRIGQDYLALTRSLDEPTRAASIASYEDGGLTRVFGAFLRASDWQGSGPRAFKFFLEQHILFDSEGGGGHGMLARHLGVDDRIQPLWTAFRDLLLATVPRLAPEISRTPDRAVEEAAD